jgi:leucyl aminopeptidase
MTSQPTLKKLYGSKETLNLKEFTSQIWVVEKGFSLNKITQFLDEQTAKKVSNFIKLRKFKFKSNNQICFDLSSKQKFSILVVPKKLSTFSSLELAREVLSNVKSETASAVLVNLSAASECQELCLIDSFVSAAVALNYQAPKYETAKQKPETKKDLTVSFKVNHSRLAALQKQGQSSEASAHKTNLVRNLAQRAGNDLTPAVYVKTAKEMAEKAGLKTEFLSLSELKKMKAGAFLAVAQGAGENSGGILKLSYQPKTGKRKVALVGKGITFDTGGNNLKTGSHMFGMNNDMAGSAVVLALCLLAAEEKWPVQITGYMAITENVLNEKAYRPNDVVTSLKGKTIEVIDTDAEGRMILSDTLTLASREKPDLVIDFATLTGSVIRALGTQYSGGYSNRKHWLSKIRKAGVLSGERVWSFPNDPDYGRCLKSDIADIKQCRLTGGVDHIEAAFFLSQFVEKGVEWVHIDLGAMDPEEPLAHIPKKPSGFGIRIGKELIHMA